VTSSKARRIAYKRNARRCKHHVAALRRAVLLRAGTHPGGGVMAAAGHNAAQRILRDRRFGRLRRLVSAPS
jgi:phytoene dehydrogenase-like protein